LGPFCKFKLDCQVIASGVYAITVEGDLRYIGECENFRERFGTSGYGYIAARNCHRDGQATNCKINSRVLRCSKLGQSIVVWFYPTSNYKNIEAELIDQLHPPWNGRQRGAVSNGVHTSSLPLPTSTRSLPIRSKSASVVTRDFSGTLRELFV